MKGMEDLAVKQYHGSVYTPNIHESVFNNMPPARSWRLEL